MYTNIYSRTIQQDSNVLERMASKSLSNSEIELFLACPNDLRMVHPYIKGISGKV